MALVQEFLNGCEDTPPTKVDSKWNSVVQAPTAVTGRGGIGTSWKGGQDYAKTLTSADTKLLGFAFFFGSIPNVNVQIASLESSVTVFLGFTLRVLQSGTLQLVRNTTGLAVATATDPFQSLQIGVWYYIEFAYRAAAAAGSVVDIYLNGLAVTGLSGAPTSALTGDTTTISQMRICPGAGGLNQIDDLYLLTGTGGFVAGDFWGDIHVLAPAPNGVGNHTTWTPSAGANWDAANEKPWDDDQAGGTFVETAVAGNVDSYAYEDIANIGFHTIAAVKGVQLNVFCRKVEPGASHTLTPRYVDSASPGTLYEGTAQSVTDVIKDVRMTMATNPQAGAWTVANFNAGRFGFKAD